MEVRAYDSQCSSTEKIVSYTLKVQDECKQGSMIVDANQYSASITHTIGGISTENIPAFDISPAICANGCLSVVYSLSPNIAEIRAGITFNYQSDTSSTFTIQNLQDLSLGGDALNPIIYLVDIMIKDPRDHEYSGLSEKATLTVKVINPCY